MRSLVSLPVFKVLAAVGLLVFVPGCHTAPKATIPTREFEGRTRVACVGDSITAGAGLPDPAGSSYPAVLAELLGPAYDVRNFGVSGATLLRDGDHPYADTAEFDAARQFRPHVVVVVLGTNDSKPPNWRFRDAFERDLYAMVRSFLTLPSQPTVYVGTPPTVFHDHWGITADVVAGEIAPRIRRVCSRARWPLVDLQLATRNSSDFFPDGVHPDAAGAASLAGVVEAAFRGR